jgi:hypothetical protein
LTTTLLRLALQGAPIIGMTSTILIGSPQTRPHPIGQFCQNQNEKQIGIQHNVIDSSSTLFQQTPNLSVFL